MLLCYVTSYNISYLLLKIPSKLVQRFKDWLKQTDRQDKKNNKCFNVSTFHTHLVKSSDIDYQYYAMVIKLNKTYFWQFETT